MVESSMYCYHEVNIGTFTISRVEAQNKPLFSYIITNSQIYNIVLDVTIWKFCFLSVPM